MGEVIQFPGNRVQRRGALTRRQLKALRFIESYRLAHGEWPSMERLAREIGVRSLAGTKRIVMALLDAGAIEKPRGRV